MKLRWYRLHFSTCILLAAAAAAWALAIVPGQEFDSWNGPENVFEARIHGFPMEFIRREVTLDGLLANESIGSCWALKSHVVQFRAWPLVLDILIALASLAILAALMERRHLRRRLFQFSLAELLVFTTCAAIACAWAAAQWTDYKTLRRHLSSVIGIEVDQESLALMTPADPVATAVLVQDLPDRWIKPKLPLWIREFFGDEALVQLGFNTPQRFSISWRKQSHASLRYIVERFPDKVNLQVYDALTDEDLELISQLTPLQRLQIKANDRALSKLQGLVNLRALTLGELFGSGSKDNPPSNITSATFARLASLPDLEVLEIMCEIKAEDWASIAHTAKLRRLSIYASAIDGAAIDGLRSMKRLEKIMLFSSREKNIDDEALTKVNRARPDCSVGLNE